MHEDAAFWEVFPGETVGRRIKVSSKKVVVIFSVIIVIKSVLKYSFKKS